MVDPILRADGGCSRLRFWDSQTGHTIPSSLSDLLLPFPVRSISWHPTQHMMAVATVIGKDQIGRLLIYQCSITFIHGHTDISS